jgi:hypothetical protein
VRLSPAVAIVALLLLAQAAPARAEEPAARQVGSAAFIVFTAGNVVDTVGTIYGKAHGNVELDPALKGGTARIIAVKTISSLAFAGLMQLAAEHGHTRIAKVLGYIGGGVTFAAGVNNIRIAK